MIGANQIGQAKVTTTPYVMPPFHLHSFRHRYAPVAVSSNVEMGCNAGPRCLKHPDLAGERPTGGACPVLRNEARYADRLPDLAVLHGIKGYPDLIAGIERVCAVFGALPPHRTLSASIIRPSESSRMLLQLAARYIGCETFSETKHGVVWCILSYSILRELEGHDPIPTRWVVRPPFVIVLAQTHRFCLYVLAKISMELMSPAANEPPRRRPGRPKTTGPGEQIVIRVHEPMLSRIDWLAQESEATRAETVRRLIEQALACLAKKKHRK
jgi:hypothetical protein